MPVQESPDPAIAVGWSLVDDGPDGKYEAGILGFPIRAASLGHLVAPFDQIGAGDAQRTGHGLHREPSSRSLQDTCGKVGFFRRATSMASLRISFSIVLRPSKRSRSRTRFSSSRTRDVPTTSSSACTAACPPSIMRRFQANNCEGAMPARRATKDTLMPGCMASSTSRTFSAADHRRRRCTEVMTSTREIGSSERVVIVVIIADRVESLAVGFRFRGVRVKISYDSHFWICPFTTATVTGRGRRLCQSRKPGTLYRRFRRRTGLGASRVHPRAAEVDGPPRLFAGGSAEALYLRVSQSRSIEPAPGGRVPPQYRGHLAGSDLEA